MTEQEIERIELIKFYDPSTVSLQSDGTDDFEKLEVVTAFAVGFVIKEDKEKIILASFGYQKNGDSNGYPVEVHIIPICSIISRNTLVLLEEFK